MSDGFDASKVFVKHDNAIKLAFDQTSPPLRRRAAPLLHGAEGQSVGTGRSLFSWLDRHRTHFRTSERNRGQPVEAAPCLSRRTHGANVDGHESWVAPSLLLVFC